MYFCSYTLCIGWPQDKINTFHFNSRGLEMDVIRMFAKLYETPYEEMRGFVTCTSGIHDVFVNHAVICIYTLKSHSNFCVFLLSHKSFLIKKKSWWNRRKLHKLMVAKRLPQREKQRTHAFIADFKHDTLFYLQGCTTTSD